MPDEVPHAVHGITGRVFIQPRLVADLHEALHPRHEALLPRHLLRDDHGVILRVAVVRGIEERHAVPELFAQRRQLRPPKRALRIRLEAIRWKARLLARRDHCLRHPPVPRTQRVVRIRPARHLRHDLALIHAPRAELIRRILLQTGAMQIRMHLRLIFVDHRQHRRELGCLSSGLLIVKDFTSQIFPTRPVPV
jgi:hypothetical protein